MNDTNYCDTYYDNDIEIPMYTDHVYIESRDYYKEPVLEHNEWLILPMVLSFSSKESNNEA